VPAIKGVEAAGLKVYGVEIAPTGAINIWTQPRQVVPDKQISTKLDDTTPEASLAFLLKRDFSFGCPSRIVNEQRYACRFHRFGSCYRSICRSQLFSLHEMNSRGPFHSFSH
jgi:hypothetical protein